MCMILGGKRYRSDLYPSLDDVYTLHLSMFTRADVCRFFSALIQRSAKAHKRLGGGSLTMLMVMPGVPATGVTRRRRPIDNYQHLSEEQRAKLQSALDAQELQTEATQAAEGLRTVVSLLKH